MRFRYEGHDKMGRPMRGELEAATEEAASAELRVGGVYTLKLEPASEEPMKVVLEHKEAQPDPRFVEPDEGVGIAEKIEDDIEQAVKEAEAEEAEAPHEPTVKEEVERAILIADEIREAVVGDGELRETLIQFGDEVKRECLKEMLAELAVRRFARPCNSSEPINLVREEEEKDIVAEFGQYLQADPDRHFKRVK